MYYGRTFSTPLVKRDQHPKIYHLNRRFILDCYLCGCGWGRSFSFCLFALKSMNSSISPWQECSMAPGPQRILALPSSETAPKGIQTLSLNSPSFSLASSRYTFHRTSPREAQNPSLVVPFGHQRGAFCWQSTWASTSLCLAGIFHFTFLRPLRCKWNKHCPPLICFW